MIGGTSITIKGSNFLSPVFFNQALLCKFGTYSVTASILNSDTMICASPPSSKQGAIDFTIDIENPKEYYMVTKKVKFFYEEKIEINSV